MYWSSFNQQACAGSSDNNSNQMQNFGLFMSCEVLEREDQKKYGHNGQPSAKERSMN